MNIKDNYREKVLEIWKKFKNNDIFSDPKFQYRKYPLLPEIVNENCLLFIGMNPSFRKGSIIPEDKKPIGFYLKQENQDISYFEKMKDIAKYCKTEWTHLDLFFIRETSQKLIESLSYDKEGIEFLNAQLKISFEIIEKANPKLIIVANALASEFFGKKKETKHRNLDKIWQGLDFYFDNNIWEKETTFNSEIGTYNIKLNENLVPIIFSGMLSGQRALDIGSFERLKWQTKMILQKK